ncbi:MAG TPA: hypothetical protein EYG52_10015, partial [Pseudomonadales bacterium]|nr:hypothetical protein [Pseudomonadales bacterium]
KKFERLCRYITQPAISGQRLSPASNGNVIVALKRSYADGTSHVVLCPMEGNVRSLLFQVPKTSFRSSSRWEQSSCDSRPIAVSNIPV